MARVIQIPDITEEISVALLEGYTQFFMIVGEKNFGKSTLALQILYEIYRRYVKDWEETWKTVFHSLSFTAKQFYDVYASTKAKVDSELVNKGLDNKILELDPEDNWDALVDMVLKSKLEQNVTFEDVRKQYRIKGHLIDDIAAHMNRLDVSIYYDKFFQQLFADFTLMRPYIACLLGTTPDLDDVPRVVLKHVTGLIICDRQGHAVFKKNRRYVRFKGKSMESFYKLYDGSDITWNKLQPNVYSYYEILRHVMSRRVTQKAQTILNQIEEAEKVLTPSPLSSTQPSINVKSISVESGQFAEVLNSVSLRNSIKQTLQFQGERVTEGYSDTEPDLVVWKDEITPKEVISVKQTTQKLVDVARECGKEREFAEKFGFKQLHLIVFNNQKDKVFDDLVSFDQTVDLSPSNQREGFKVEL